MEYVCQDNGGNGCSGVSEWVDECVGVPVSIDVCVSVKVIVMDGMLCVASCAGVECWVPAIVAHEAVAECTRL